MVRKRLPLVSWLICASRESLERELRSKLCFTLTYYFMRESDSLDSESLRNPETRLSKSFPHLFRSDWYISSLTPIIVFGFFCRLRCWGYSGLRVCVHSVFFEGANLQISFQWSMGSSLVINEPLQWRDGCKCGSIGPVKSQIHTRGVLGSTLPSGRLHRHFLFLYSTRH